MADNCVISDADIKQMSDENLIELVKTGLSSFTDIQLSDAKIKKCINKVKKYRKIGSDKLSNYIISCGVTPTDFTIYSIITTRDEFNNAVDCVKNKKFI